MYGKFENISSDYQDESDEVNVEGEVMSMDVMEGTIQFSSLMLDYYLKSYDFINRRRLLIFDGENTLDNSFSGINTHLLNNYNNNTLYNSSLTRYSLKSNFNNKRNTRSLQSSSTTTLVSPDVFKKRLLNLINKISRSQIYYLISYNTYIGEHFIYKLFNTTNINRVNSFSIENDASYFDLTQCFTLINNYTDDSAINKIFIESFSFTQSTLKIIDEEDYKNYDNLADQASQFIKIFSRNNSNIITRIDINNVCEKSIPSYYYIDTEYLDYNKYSYYSNSNITIYDEEINNLSDECYHVKNITYDTDVPYVSRYMFYQQNVKIVCDDYSNNNNINSNCVFHSITEDGFVLCICDNINTETKIRLLQRELNETNDVRFFSSPGFSYFVKCSNNVFDSEIFKDNVLSIVIVALIGAGIVLVVIMHLIQGRMIKDRLQENYIDKDKKNKNEKRSDKKKGKNGFIHDDDIPYFRDSASLFYSGFISYKDVLEYCECYYNNFISNNTYHYRSPLLNMIDEDTLVSQSKKKNNKAQSKLNLKNAKNIKKNDINNNDFNKSAINFNNKYDTDVKLVVNYNSLGEIDNNNLNDINKDNTIDRLNNKEGDGDEFSSSNRIGICNINNTDNKFNTNTCEIRRNPFKAANKYKKPRDLYYDHERFNYNLFLKKNYRRGNKFIGHLKHNINQIHGLDYFETTQNNSNKNIIINSNTTHNSYNNSSSSRKDIKVNIINYNSNNTDNKIVYYTKPYYSWSKQPLYYNTLPLKQNSYLHDLSEYDKSNFNLQEQIFIKEELVDIYLNQITRKELFASCLFKIEFLIPQIAKIFKLVLAVSLLLMWIVFFYFEEKLVKINEELTSKVSIYKLNMYIYICIIF